MPISFASVNRTRLKTALFIFYAVFAPTTEALPTDAPPLFSSAWLIEATLEAPFDQIMRARSEEQELDGLFSYRNPDGSQQKLDVKVRIRGQFRARADICEFAPLRLNFKKKQVADTEFARQNKLKLVTHCDNSGRLPEQFLLKEYLTYQFLAALTENAFQTRLLRVTYVDSDRKSKSRTRYAFLIEGKKGMADRIGATLAKVEPVELDRLDRAQTNLVTVFSYLIGNTDFSGSRGAGKGFCCHNIVLFAQGDGNILPVPFDFDFAGMVDAPYAEPNPRFGIHFVTTRLYRGLCQNNNLLNETANHFLGNRHTINALIGDLQGLSKKSKKDMTRFVDDFYKTISDEKSIQQKFVKKCLAEIPPTSRISATPPQSGQYAGVYSSQANYAD